MNPQYIIAPEGTRPGEDVKDVLLNILRNVQGITGAETALLALLEHNGNTIHYIEGTGLHAAEFRDKHNPAAANPSITHIFEGHNAVLLSINSGDLFLHHYHARKLGISSVLAAPVYHKDILVGALLLLDKTFGGEFSLQDQTTVQEYARQVAPLLAICLQDPTKCGGCL